MHCLSCIVFKIILTWGHYNYKSKLELQASSPAHCAHATKIYIHNLLHMPMSLYPTIRDCTHITISRLEGGGSLKIYLYDNMGVGLELGKFGE